VSEPCNNGNVSQRLADNPFYSQVILVGSCSKGERFFQLEFGAHRFDINPRYGNTSFSGRKKLSATRKNAKAAKKALAPALELDKMDEMMEAAAALNDYIIEDGPRELSRQWEARKYITCSCLAIDSGIWHRSAAWRK